MIDFYRLGMQYSLRQQNEYVFDDLPEMNLMQTLEFNRGFDDGIRNQRMATRMLWVLCFLTVGSCVFFWWIGK